MRPNLAKTTVIRAAAGLVTVALVLGGSASAAAQTASGATVPGEVLVRFQPRTDEALRGVAHARAGATVVRRLARTGYELVRIPTTTPLDAALAAYRSDPAVKVAEPNHRGRIALSPTDACHVEPCDGYAGQWHHRLTNTPFGWDAFPGKTFTAAEKRSLTPVTIAVLDTKIDATHPDWSNGAGADAADGGQLDLANAKDWVPASRQGGSAAYHGTFVAGLAAAATGNGRSAAGVGYAARILPLTVVDGGGNTDAATLADAIVYAWQRGARIINLSLGILGDSQAVRDAIRLVTAGDASLQPALVVAAAGNNTGSTAFYPGSYPEVMSVSGTNASDGRAACSNYNANVSVAAPADRLIGLTMMPTERIQAPCGTSAAAPQVSGLAALLLMQDPTRTPQQIRGIIERAADDLGTPGRDDHFGHGRINAARALRDAGPTSTGARATAAVAAGGTATIVATASSTTAVRSAQVIVGRPDAAPVAMSATDGSFGGRTESLRASVRLPAGTAPGPHAIWVRAFDGTTWGPTTVGIVAVDGRAPTISNVTTTNAVRAANQPMTISFSIDDDYSTSFTYAVELRSQATGAIVHRETITNAARGAQTYRWMPSLNVPGGPFRAKIGVADQAANATTTETGALVT